jgi:hypothetical protein
VGAALVQPNRDWDPSQNPARSCGTSSTSSTAAFSEADRRGRVREGVCVPTTSSLLAVDGTTGAADAAAFARAVHGGRPFVGTAAVAAGILTPHDLRVRFTRILPGVHLARGATLDADGRVRAVALWAPPGSVIAGHAAALLHGEREVSEEMVHRVVDVYLSSSARTPRRIRVRRVHVPFRSEDVTVINGITCTSVGRTALDLARWEPHDVEAIVAVDALCNATGTPVSSVAAATRTLRGLHGRRRALALFDRCDHRADSPPETRLRLEYADSPLPDPELQVEIRDSTGFLSPPPTSATAASASPCSTTAVATSRASSGTGTPT